MALGIIGIDDAIIIGVIAYSAYQVKEAVRKVKRAKEKARQARQALVQRFEDRFDAEKELSVEAQQQVIATLPWITGAIVVAGVAWAAAPPRRR